MTIKMKSMDDWPGPAYYSKPKNQNLTYCFLKSELPVSSWSVPVLTTTTKIDLHVY